MYCGFGSHIYAMCPTWDATRMRLGTGAGNGESTERGVGSLGSKGLGKEWSRGQGSQVPAVRTKRIATLAPASTMSPTLLRCKNTKCPKMRHKHAHEFRSWPFAILNSATDRPTGCPFAFCILARKCSANKWGSRRLTLVHRQYII